MSNRRRRPPPSLRDTVAQRAEAAAHAAAAGERRRRRILLAVAGTVAAVAVVALTAVIVTRSSGEDAVPSEVAVRLGCASCHSVDGSRREGPTWQGLAGSSVALADGSSVTADDEYLRRAITEPAAQVRAGYPATMPTIDVTPAELDQLVAEINDLA